MKLTDMQLQKANSLKWYHALEFGEYQTAGRFDLNKPPNVTLFGVLDLLSYVDVRGLKCLDVGPAHGLISFGLALKGGDVTTINVGGGKPPQFALGEEIYGVHIDYRHGVSLEASSNEFESGTFDIIVIAGVMYHLLSPADVFFRLRPLLKRNGLLLVETVYAKGHDEPVLVLNSEAPTAFQQRTTYFLPSVSALKGLAKLACFDTLATRASAPSRFALIARATVPEEVNSRTEMCVKMHDFGFEDPLFNISKIKTQSLKSPISFDGYSGHKDIDVRKYIPEFPSHPKEMRNPIGVPFYG